VLLSPLKGVQFSKLSPELVNKNIEVVEKGLSLKSLFTYSVYKEIVNYFYIGFVLVSSYSV